jgi:hypothetical protein
MLLRIDHVVSFGPSPATDFNIETILIGTPFFYCWRKGRVELHDDVLMKISLRISGNSPCGQLSRLLATTLE